jgi:hypothetical protein
MDSSGETLARRDGPSPLKATMIAALAAAAILVAVVLPAEYGIDWTGIGSLMGLTAMGRDKVVAAKAAQTEAAAPASSAKTATETPATSSAQALRNDAIEIRIGPGVGLEYKAVLSECESMVFEWDAVGSELSFDFHGEPAKGPEGMFLSFRKGAASKDAGSLRAPFAGTHGWYWKNPGTAPVVVKLRVSGFHSGLRKM